jgi:hypothetical protein
MPAWIIAEASGRRRRRTAVVVASKTAFALVSGTLLSQPQRTIYIRRQPGRDRPVAVDAPILFDQAITPKAHSPSKHAASSEKYLDVEKISTNNFHLTLCSLTLPLAHKYEWTGSVGLIWHHSFLASIWCL